MFRRIFKKVKYKYTKEVIKIEELTEKTLIINLTNNNVFQVVSGTLEIGAFNEKCFQLMTKDDIIIRGFSEIEKDFAILIKID